jgi:hypothetical protein
MNQPRISSLLVLLAASVGSSQTHPIGSPENPRQITSADMGPDIDPAEFLSQPYNALPMFSSFRSFMSVNYASANVWVHAENDEQEIYDSRVVYSYPEFYKPTWKEVFDVIARQMRCTWEWNPGNRQFKFARSDRGPFFGVDLADGWRREDRGYVWHAPKDQNFGMDIYYFGHFTSSAQHPDLIPKVRTHYALQSFSSWPESPTEKQMQLVQAGGAEALYIRCDTPRPGAVWRQWSLVRDGHAFLIVSAMPAARERELSRQVDQMVATFRVGASSTQPASAPAEN